MHKKLKAVSTVEAAWVVAICLSFILVAILFSYDVFGECIEFIGEERKTIDVVKIFRGKDAVLEFVKYLKE